MTVIEQLVERNQQVATRHTPLPNLPRLNLCIVTCPDPRVDPMAVFDLRPGDAAVVRAAAGRVSPIVLQQLLFLTATVADYGQRPSGLELLLMAHTDCGIKNFARPDRIEALSAFLGSPAEEIESRSVEDPRAAVAGDIELLARNPMLPADLSVTGVVYDVTTGRVEVVERRSPLRTE
jgi:carbonic anhydrase